MSDFKRRPFMAGHTDVFILSQPYISGTEHINSDGQLDSIEALVSGGSVIELSFETESGSGDFQLDLSVATDTERTLAGIVEAINTSFGSLVTAADFEGCLRLQTVSSGYDAVNGNAYIRILPNQSGALIEDAAPLFGFPRHPHPEATATAGDLASAPVRPLTQVNRPGVAFLARGEDRVSQNFNRALHQLAINADSLNTRLKERVPVPTVIDFASTSLRLITDVDGSILGVDLSAGYGDGIDNIITPTSSVFVGGSELSATSSLAKIAEFFSVQDQDDNEIQADERVVRVGAVINGFLAGSVSVPAFVSETSPPTSALPDSATYTEDYGNLLGVAVPKVAATAITAVRDGSVLECETATFETDNVLKGDIVTISGSTINSPINHDGDYYVETVISETELEVRPLDSENVILLNESSGAGLGSVEISTDTKFARAGKCVLLFSPPIADFPPDRLADDGLTTIDGVLRIVLGVEAPLGEVPTTFLTRSAILTSAEVDAFVTRRLWRRMSFDGVYQGQSYDYRGSQKGGGAEGRITHGPISLNLVAKQARVAPTLTSGSGSFEMRGSDIVLTTAAATVLSDTDIGRVIYMTDTDASPLFADATPFVLSEFLSYREARLTPPVDYKDWRDSDLPAGTSHTCAFDIADEGQAAVQAAMLFVANDETFDEVTAAKTGTVFIRNHRDGADDEVSPGTSTLHVERIRHLRADATGSTAVTDARFLTVTTSGKTVVLDRSGDVVYPEYNMNLFYSKGSTTRSAGGVGCTLLRIVNGENAGFYEVYDHNTSTGTFDVRPIENAFDGQDNSWAGFAASSVTEVGNLYNVVFSAGGKRSVDDPVDGALDVISGITAFADAADKSAYGAATAVARAIQAHWIGTGAGLVVRVNDPEFISLSFDNASVGDAIDIAVWAPADGIKVQAIGSGVSTAAAGRTYGLSVTAEGYGTDASKSTPAEDGVDMVADRSFSAAVTQHGRDAGLVVSKYENSTIDLSGLSGASLFSGASLVVARGMVGVEKAPSGMGSAIEVLGSMWVHTSSAEDQPYGGVFSEDVVGAGKWLYPMWGYDPDKHFLTPYDTEPLVTNSRSWDGYNVLGHPGIICPPLDPSGSTQPDPTGTFNVPDYDTFNFHHDGVLELPDYEDAGLLEPLNKVVGCIVESTSPGHGVEGERYAILGVVLPDPSGLAAVFALRGSTPVAAAEAGSFKIRGLRWDQANLDIAEFFHVGTHVMTTELSRLPLVTTDRLTSSARATAEFPDSGTQGYANLRNITRPKWGPGAAGAGIGGADESTVFTDTAAADALNGGWEGTYDAPRHTHMYQSGALEGRPPFFSSIALPISQAANPIGHVARDFVWYGTGSVTYEPEYGGVIKVSLTSSGNPLHLVARGRRYQYAGHVYLKVLLRFACSDTSVFVGSSDAVVVSLRDSETNADVVSASIAYADLTQDVLETHSVVLELDATRALAEGELSLSRLNAELLLHVTFNHSGVLGRSFNFQEISVENLTQPLVVDAPLVVNGPVYAESLHYTNPIRGYDTINPMRVELFGGADYARNWSWPADDFLVTLPNSIFNYGGRFELYGGPGLIRTKNEDIRYNEFVVEEVIDSDPPAFDLDTGLQMDALHEIVNKGWNVTSAGDAPPTDGSVTGWPPGSGTPDGGEWGLFSDEIELFNLTYNGNSSYTTDPGTWTGSAAYETMISIAQEMLDASSSAVGRANQQQSNNSSVSARREADIRDWLIYGISYAGATTDGSTTAGFYDAKAAPDRWIRPHVDITRLFSKGVNSATISLYNGAYDPLYYALLDWYKQNASLEDITPNETIDPTGFVPPGHVGFCAELHAPHGSLLSTLDLTLSIENGYGPNTPYGVYHSIPAEYFKIGQRNSDTKYLTVGDRDIWSGPTPFSDPGVTGVLVEIWRHSHTNVEDNFGRDVAGPHVDGVAGWTRHVESALPPGGGELVFRTVTAQRTGLAAIIATNPYNAIGEHNTQNNDPTWPSKRPANVAGEHLAHREKHHELSVDLQSEILNATGTVPGDDASLLRVDRRHYSYTLVIRFMGGKRTYNQDGAGPVEYPEVLSSGDLINPNSNEFGDPGWDEPVSFRIRHVPSINGYNFSGGAVGVAGALSSHDWTSSTSLWVYGTYHPGPMVVEEGLGAASPVGWVGNWYRKWTHKTREDVDYPIVKFRGATVSWITDRGGDGGWGS